jgi:phosphoribosyl-ATP pyrophosphohydrolase
VRRFVADRVDRAVAAAGATGDKGAMREKDRAHTMFTLDELARTIDQRAGASAEMSYTRSLLDKGAAHCARKFGEEAIELAIAAAALDESAVRAEAADVLYHLLVVLRARGVALSSVLDELDKRSRRSGHEEKAARAG